MLIKDLNSLNRRGFVFNAMGSIAGASMTAGFLISSGEANALAIPTVTITCKAGTKADIDVISIAVRAFGANANQISHVSKTYPKHGSIRITNYNGRAFFMQYTPHKDFFGLDNMTINCRVKNVIRPMILKIDVVSAAQTSLWAGPHSKLPWYSGGWNNSAALTALRTNPIGGKVRKLDVLTTGYPRHGWQTWAGATGANAWKASTGQWYNWLVSDNTPAVSIAINPFCSDPGNIDPFANRLTSWPASKTAAQTAITTNTWIAPNYPAGFQKTGLTDDQKRDKHMQVWEKMLEGYFDHIWRAGLQNFKNNLPVLNNKRVIWRPFWESTGVGGRSATTGKYSLWGTTGSIYSAAALGGMRTLDDVNIVRACYRHFNDIVRDVCDGWDNQFHWNPLRNLVRPDNPQVWGSGFGSTIDLIVPSDWDLIGPDWYDRDHQNGNTVPAAGLSNAQKDAVYLDRWNQISVLGSQSNPVGIVHWFNWLRNVARVSHPNANPNVRMGIAEWGAWRLAGSYGNSSGDDNPIYVKKMYELFAANADIMGYECVFSNIGSRGDEYTYLSPPGWSPASQLPRASAMYGSKYATLT